MNDRLKHGFTSLVVTATFLLASIAMSAETLTLMVSIKNGSESGRDIPIKASLPDGVTPERIISTDGLLVGYDVVKRVYFVHGDTILEANEEKTFRVVLEDIWAIDPEGIDRIEKHAIALAGKALPPRKAADARAARDSILKLLRVIRESQEAGKASVAGPHKHIELHARNLSRMQQAVKQVADLEDLVAESGIILDQILGQLPALDPTPMPVTNKTATIRISAHNPSKTHPKELDLKHDLPPEIGADDILDTAGLNVGLDLDTGSLYLSKKGLMLQPDESRSFNVTVADRWAATAGRLGRAREKCESLTTVYRETEQTGVKNLLQSISNRIALLASQPPPESVGADYAAFFRRQANAIAAIESDLARAESLPSSNAPGGNPPNLTLTWYIIYGILGILAIVSLSALAHNYRSDRRCEK